MNFPEGILDCFAKAEDNIRSQRWYDQDWSVCSGLWSTERYGETVVLRLTRKGWCSVFPISVDDGGELHYAAWVDEKLHCKSAVRFEMHLFAFPGGARNRKTDFTEAFRAENEERIRAFGFHDTKRGPAVPYGGTYKYADADDLEKFLVNDLSNFAGLKESIDRHLKLSAPRT